MLKSRHGYWWLGVCLSVVLLAACGDGGESGPSALAGDQPAAVVSTVTPGGSAAAPAATEAVARMTPTVTPPAPLAAQVNGHRLRNGTISQEDRRRLVQKSSEIGTSPLYIDDTPSRTLTEIAAVARRLKRKEGLALIVIDYLQLIEPDNPRDPRQEQVARIARRLKGMSRELDIPVLCLAQLNRQAEASRDNRPRLNHLRESGAIEQDADLVMFVHREEYYQTNDEDRERVRGQAEIIIAKQRNGPIGDVKLLWQHDFTRFVNLEHRPYDEFEQFSSF